MRTLSTLGVCGWLVPAGSVEALVEAMRTALLTPVAELERLGRAGSARAAERHDGTVEIVKLATLIAQSCETRDESHLDPNARAREQSLVWDRTAIQYETGQPV